MHDLKILKEQYKYKLMLWGEETRGDVEDLVIMLTS